MKSMASVLKIKLSSALLAITATAVTAQSLCQGAFPNPITDVCWDCMFPIKFMGVVNLNFGISAEDYDSNTTGALCICAQTLQAGVSTSYWEPRYMADATNVPGCMPALGGANITPPYNANEMGGTSQPLELIQANNKGSFQHVNLYVNPIATALGIINNSPCLDNRPFDTPYVSWADPTWGDDALSLMLTPYAFAFANFASVAAEGIDGLAATTGFPLPQLFWVAGSWGPMYPATGNVAVATTPEQVSHLLITRALAKMHAAGAQFTSAGSAAMATCGPYGVPELIMDKRQYKTTRTYPFPDNTCTPIGRPLAFQEAGAARPNDKDYGYFIFQKKDCCTPVIGAGS